MNVNKSENKPPAYNGTNTSSEENPDGCQFSSKAPIFADLFYAAVIGFAVSQLSYDKPYHLLFLIIAFLFVLEDWYAYNRVAKPTIVYTKDYTFYALIVEFFILVFWSLGFDAIKSMDRSSFIYLSLFMGVRWFAGIKHCIQKRKILSRYFLMENLYLLTSITGIALYTVEYDCMTFSLRFIIFTLIWLFCISVWWTLHKTKR